MTQPLAFSFKITADALSAMQAVRSFVQDATARFKSLVLPDPTQATQAGLVAATAATQNLAAAQTAVKNQGQLPDPTVQVRAGLKASVDAAGKLRDEMGRLVVNSKGLEVAVKGIAQGANVAYDKALRLREANGRFIGLSNITVGGKSLAPPTPDVDPTKSMRDGIDATLPGVAALAAKWLSVAAAVAAVGVAFKKGIASNAETESATLGIKALIAGLYQVQDANGKLAEGPAALAIAAGLAEDQVQKLRIAGLQTAATFEQLLGAYQQAVGPGAAAGLGLDQIREFTVGIVQAAGAIGVPMHQLGEEVRSILAGDITVNSRVAKALQITNEQIKSWKEQNVLAEKLTDKLKVFRLMGAEITQTWTATMSNLADAFQLFLGKIAAPAFQGVKKAIQDAMKGAFDFDTGGISDQFKGLEELGTAVFTGIGKLLADAITGAATAAQDLSSWFDRNRQTVGEIADAAGRIVNALKLAVGQVTDAGTGLSSTKKFAEGVRDAMNGVAVVVAVIVDATKGLAGVVGYVGGVVASVLLDPLIGVSRVLSNITGKDYTSGLEKVKAETEKFKAASKDYALNAFKFTTAQQMADEIRKAYAASPLKAIEPGEDKKAPGGTAKPPPQGPSADAKKAALRYADALRHYEDAKADADKKIAKVTNDATVRDLEASFKQRLITQEAYLREKARLDAEENASDVAAARKKAEALQAQIAAQTDPAKRKKLQGDLLKAQADIAQLEGKGADIPVRLKLELAAFREQVESLRIEIKAEILDQEGQPYEAAIARLRKKTQDLLLDPRVRGNAGLTADVNRSAKNQQAALELADAKRRMDEEAAYYRLTQDRIARDVKEGKTSELQAEKDLQAAKDKTVAGIEAYIAVLERLKKAYPKNGEFALALAQANDALEQAKKKANEVADALNRAFADNAAEGIGQFADDALSHLNRVRKGSESLGEAMKGIFLSARDTIRGLFASLFDDIAKRFQKLLADEIFKALQEQGGKGIGGVVSGFFSSAGGSGGGIDWGALMGQFTSMFSGLFSNLQAMLSSMMSGLGSMMGFAEGGHITGPGTGTSDSILARLSNGEYVLKAAAVRKWGVGMLDAMNSGYMPRQLPAFATGGLALSGGSGGTQPVNVTNNNTSRLYLDLNHVAAEIGGHPQFGRDVIKVILANKSKLGLSGG